MTGQPNPAGMKPRERASIDRSNRSTGELWVRRGCALMVAAVAAYSSYAHQRQFALNGGADPIAAALWPLSVDGLVILASTGLLTERAETVRRARWAVRLAFLLGVAVSLAANIAAAPTLTWQPILVAGWPPVALLLAVELVLHARHRDHADPTAETTGRLPVESTSETEQPLPARPNGNHRRNGHRKAENLMWTHYERELALGRTPTGAE
ncbi:MAG: DUF2637 domain-containing protein, partial [Pseudonocardiaceae bacterium]